MPAATAAAHPAAASRRRPARAGARLPAHARSRALAHAGPSPPATGVRGSHTEPVRHITVDIGRILCREVLNTAGEEVAVIDVLLGQVGRRRDAMLLVIAIDDDDRIIDIIDSFYL